MEAKKYTKKTWDNKTTKLNKMRSDEKESSQNETSVQSQCLQAKGEQRGISIC